MSVCLEANNSTVLSQASSQVQVVGGASAAATVPPPVETLPLPQTPSPATQVTTSIKCTSATSGSKVIVANTQSLTTSVTVTSGIGGGNIVHHKQPVITVVNNPIALKGLPNAVAVAAPTYTLNPSVVKSTNSVTLANVPAATLVGLTTSAATILSADKDASINNNNNNTEKLGPIHNVFVKKSSLVEGGTVAAAACGGGSSASIATTLHPSDHQIPLSHKILTANTFPSNNVITSLNSTPVLKTVNGQRPLNSSSCTPSITTASNKVKIISNVVMAPATQPSQLHVQHLQANSTTNVTVAQQQAQLVSTAGPSHSKQQQHRFYQPASQHHQHAKHAQQISVQSQQQQQAHQVIVGNGATKYLNKSASQGIIHSTNVGGSNTILNNSGCLSQPTVIQQAQQASSHPLPPPPPPQMLGERKMVYHGSKNKNCHQAAYKGPGAVQRTGAGLRTIPPQRPSPIAQSQSIGPAKTNYIGKHAVQAQRIKHTKAKAAKAPLHNTYTGPIPHSSLHHPSQQQTLHQHQLARLPSTQLTFNQALTAQILETLGTDMPYKSMNHHYDEQHHNNPSLSSSSLHQSSGSMISSSISSPSFSSPPHYNRQQQVYQHQQNQQQQHQYQRHNPQQQLLQQMMTSDEDQFTNLDKLSLVCQTVLLDHNYHIKSPTVDSQSPPPSIPVITTNALIPPQLLSPTGSHSIPGLPQLSLPTSLGGIAANAHAQQQLNGLLMARERRNSRSEILQQHREQQQKQQQHLNSVSNDIDDDAASDISDPGPPFRPGMGDTEGEETDTAPEAEAETDQGNQVNSGDGHGGSYGDYVTRCICGFIHDDGYMIECDRCKVWQHVRCVIRNRKVPDDYMCEECEPSKVCDRQRARALQQQWMRDIQERDAKEREARMRKENQQHLPHQNNHGPQHSDTDSSDNDSGGVRMVNVGVSAPAAGAATKRRKDSNRRQQRGGAGGARAKRKERKIPTKRPAKNNKNQAQNEAVSNALAVVSAQLNEADKLPQLRQWIENYEEAVTNHYSPELRARVSSIRVNGVHSDLGKVEANVHKCKVQSVPPGVKCLAATCALQANVPVVELRGKYMLSTQHKNNNLTFNNHGLVTRNYRPPGPFLFFHKLRDTTEVCVDTRTYGNSARFIRRSCTPNSHLRHVIEKGTLHLYIVTQRAVARGDELTIAHDESHEQLSASQLLELPCACAQPATCAIAQHGAAKREIAGEKEKTEVLVEGRKRRGRYSRDSVGAAITPPIEEPPVTIKTEIKVEIEDIKEEIQPNIKEEIKEEVQETPEISLHSPIKKEKKEHIQHFAKSASDFLLENQGLAMKIQESAESSDTPDGPPVKIKSEDSKVEIEESKPAETKLKVKEEVVADAPIAAVTRSTTKKETQDIKTEEEDEDEDDTQPTPVSTRRTSKHVSDDNKDKEATSASVPPVDDPKKLSREDRKLLAIMKAIERMERQEQRKQEHQAKQAHRRESDPGTGSTTTVVAPAAAATTASVTVSILNSNGNSNDGIAPTKVGHIVSNVVPVTVLAAPPVEDAKDDGTPSRPITLKRRKRKGRARTVSTHTRRNRLDSIDSVHSSDDTLQSPTQSGSASPVKPAAGLLIALSSNSNGSSSATACRSPERPSQPTTPVLLPLLATPTMQQQQHLMDNSNSSNSNSAHSSPEATPHMSSACLLVAAAMEPLESAAAAAAAAAGGSNMSGFKFPKTKKGLMNEWLLNKNDATIQPASAISPSSLQPHIPVNNCNIVSAPPTSPITYSNKNMSALAQAATYCTAGSNGGNNGGNGNGGSAKKRWLRQAISEDQCDSPPSNSMEAVPPPKKRRIPQVEIVSPQRHEDDIGAMEVSEASLQELATEMRQEYGNCISSISPPISTDASPEASNSTTVLSNPIGINLPTTPSTLVLASELIAAALTTSADSSVGATLHRVLLDPRLAPRLNSEQLVGTVEKTLSFLGFEDGVGSIGPTGSAILSPVADTVPKRPEIVTPAKRKLSITEYRQRKKLNVNDRNSNDEVINVEENSSSHSPQEGPLRNRSNSSSSATSGVSTDLDELATPSLNPDPKAGALTAFNSEPTELEKQRELGSLRLKRAFGLSLVDDNRKSTALNVENILKGDLTEPVKSSLSLASPTFPIPGSTDLPTLATVHQAPQFQPAVDAEQDTVNNINHTQSPCDHAESPPDTLTADTIDAIINSTTRIAPTVQSTPIATAPITVHSSEVTPSDTQETETPDDISTVTSEQRSSIANTIKDIEGRLLDVIPLVLPTVNANRVASSITDNLPETKVSQIDAKATATELFYTPDDLEVRRIVIVKKKQIEKVSGACEDSDVSESCIVATSYVPPFNNPLYPSTDYTSYGSVIDDECPYAGRNPSPPPNLDNS